MKILSIGNSFSDDSHAYLYELSKKAEVEIKTVNLVIGGCSLERHFQNAEANEKAYALCINGTDWKEERISIEDALKSEEFDVITLQQVSHFSGMYETYQPYLDSLISYVKEYQPNAKLYFHKTWAYEIDSNHSEYYLYNNDQSLMYKKLCEASKIAVEKVGAVIPTGDVIQTMREKIPQFDYKNGKESLCRDGFHLSLTYGRYAAALTWLTALTGKKAEPIPFMELDINILSQISDIINEIVFE